MFDTRGYHFFLTIVAVFLFSLSSHARSYIHIVSSSAIYSFAVAVAEKYHQKTQGSTPVIESTGTGGGIKIFCSGKGFRTPDIVLASRPMTPLERHYCHEKGIDDFVEMVIGFDGIVVATSEPKTAFSISRNELYQALALEIQHEPNKNFKWSDISSTLPQRNIRFIGPSSASGTREAFMQFLMKDHPSSRLRTDDVYMEASDQEMVIVQKLLLEPEALGIFSFSFLKANGDRVTPLPIENIIPSFETIVSGEYLLSRPLYLYVKKDHISLIKGLYEFVKEFISVDAVGLQGYLTFYGFIPQPEKKRLIEEEKLISLKQDYPLP